MFIQQIIQFSVFLHSFAYIYSTDSHKHHYNLDAFLLSSRFSSFFIYYLFSISFGYLYFTLISFPTFPYFLFLLLK